MSGADNYYKSFKELRVQRTDAVLTIQFNRPAKRNALRRSTLFELVRALDAGDADDAVTVIVLTGDATAFTAGNDLSELCRVQLAGDDALQAHFRSANFVITSVVKRLLMCRKVLVALVQGQCVGVGVTLCGLCDIVYVTETAEFWTPFSQLGLCAEAGSTWTLPYIMGRSKAAELLLFGTRMDAQMALRHSFAAEIVSTADLQREFWPRMAQFARLPPASLQATKRLLQKQWQPQLLEALRDECNELARLRRGPVFLAQLAAFAKRSQQHSKL